MSKIMLINVTHAEESRVGIVEDGQLESFEIESFSREHLKGNIYKGIVRRIHPAIEAAFVDIGAERDAFLPLDEICFRNLPAGRGATGGEKGRRRIKDVLKSGDEILVQIIKEQFTSKPPTLSTFYSLPGRYLVLLPGSEEAGISRKIEGEERIRLRGMLDRLDPPPGCGLIVRTAAGFDEESGELQRDLAYLTRLWDSIIKLAETRRAPAAIYREHDLVLRNIRDYFTPDIDEIVIDNEEVYERASDFLRNVMPGKEHLLRLYRGERPIFSHFGVESQIESIYKRRVQLKSGGSIVIDGTEALTAIDVNSGGSMRGASQEETAYKTNLEAAREIARQLRLRDLGGIIVVDFIDMREPKHIAEVERAMRDAMRVEKARHDMGRISRLGLLEISRQRLRPTAASSSYAACPMCEGHGLIRTTESAALVVLRKIHHRIAEGDVAQMKVALPRDVAMYLLNQKRDDLAVLEARYAARVQIVISDKLMPHQSEIEARMREAVPPLPVVRPGEVAAAEVPYAALGNGMARRVGGSRAAAAADAAPESRGPASRPGEPGDASAEGRARRRRRRGGRARRGAEAGEGAVRSASLAASAVPSDLVAPVELEPLAAASGAAVADLDRADEAALQDAPLFERHVTAAVEGIAAPEHDEVERADLEAAEAVELEAARTLPETRGASEVEQQPVEEWHEPIVSTDVEAASDLDEEGASEPQVGPTRDAEVATWLQGETEPVQRVEVVPPGDAFTAGPADETDGPAPARRRRRRGGRRGGRRRRAGATGTDSPEAAGTGGVDAAETFEPDGDAPPAGSEPMLGSPIEAAAPDTTSHPHRDESAGQTVQAAHDAPAGPAEPAES